MKKILVVFYSRSGYTRKVAENIAAACEADMEEILDLRPRKGLFGYFRSGYEASKMKLAEIKPTVANPENYDELVLGGPVWAGKMASPIRTYITRHCGKAKAIALFCTYGGSGAEKVLRGMAQLCNKQALASIAITDDEIKKQRYRDKLEKLVKAVT